jgi:hypothetical protein
MNRPTASQIEAAHALADYHARQARRHERTATNAMLGGVLAVLVALGLVWALLTWADCTASGAAMCTMAITPTRRNLWQRLLRAVRHYFRLWKIRWAEDDVRGLEEDLEAAQAWVAAAPGVIQYRRALLDALRVQTMSDELDGRVR